MIISRTRSRRGRRKSSRATFDPEWKEGQERPWDSNFSLYN
jgi:hypothetical protein